MILAFKITPLDAGFTEQWIDPDYSNLKFKFLNDKGKGKFSVSGNLKLFRDDFEFYYSDVEGETYEIKAYLKGNLFLTSNYKNINVGIDNKSFSQLSMSLVAETEYISAEWLNFNKEFNINDMEPESNDLEYNNTVITVTTDSDLFADTRLTNSTNVDDNLGKVDWDIDTIAINSNFWTGTFYEYDGTVNYKRQETRGYYVDSVAYEPDDSGTWTTAGYDETINGIDYPVYYRVSAFSDYTFIPENDPPGGEPWIDITNDTATYYDALKTVYVGVTRKVTDVIEWLFTQMGLTSIAFDDTGTSTDSFYSFKTLIGESLTYGSDTTTFMYSHLLIMNLTDFIPTDLNEQKDRPASITNVSFETLMLEFEKQNYEWFLQNRSGTYYFILQHKSDKTLSDTNPDLSNYYNKNRTFLNNISKRDPAEYNKIVNEMTGISIDFAVPEITFPNIVTTTNPRTITDNKIFFDMDDIWKRREIAYADNENNNFVLIAAQQDGSTLDYVRNATGFITGIGQSNSEFSFAFLCRWIYGEFPEVDFDLAGSSYVAVSYRKKKRDKIELETPIDNIKTDFDPSGYIDYFGDETELESLDQNSLNNAGPLILKK